MNMWLVNVYFTFKHTEVLFSDGLINKDLSRCYFFLMLIYEAHIDPFWKKLSLSAGCHVSDYKQLKEVTGYTGGSVLLPCSCNDPQSTVETFTWQHYYKRENQWTEVFKDDKYKDRLKLFNQSSPANLSLLISDLRKKDEGDYMCETSQTYTDFRVKIKGKWKLFESNISKYSRFVSFSKVQCKCKCQYDGCECVVRV